MLCCIWRTDKLADVDRDEVAALLHAGWELQLCVSGGASGATQPVRDEGVVQPAPRRAVPLERLPGVREEQRERSGRRADLGKGLRLQD